MRVMVKGRTSSNEGHFHEYLVYEDGTVEILEAVHPENEKIRHGHDYEGQFPMGEITKRGITINQSDCYPNCKKYLGQSGAGPHSHLIGLRVPTEDEINMVFFEASNEMGAQDCFVNRKFYKQEAFPLEAVQPLDTWYKDSFYGKVDLVGDAIYLYTRSDATLDVIGNNVVALDFVAAAFGDFAREYSYYVDNKMIDPIAGMKYLKPKSSWVDPEIEYARHMQDVRDFMLVEYLPKHVNDIRNFEDFVSYFKRYLSKMAKKFPITRSGFIMSSRPRTNFTGLAVDLEKGEYSEDPSKDSILKDQCKLVWLTHLAARHGFFLDKNAPWRFIYNVGIDHYTAMTPGDQLPFYDPSSPSIIFSKYYAKAYRDDLTDLATFVTSVYQSFNDMHPRYRFFCASSGRYVMATRPTDIGKNKYSDSFWFDLLYRTRLMETNLIEEPSEKHKRQFIENLVARAPTSGLETTLRSINDEVKSLNADISAKIDFSVDSRHIPVVRSFIKDRRKY